MYLLFSTFRFQPLAYGAISYRSMAVQQGTPRPDWQHDFPEVEERFLAHTGPISPDTGTYAAYTAFMK
jgi:hypothetical protein